MTDRRYWFGLGRRKTSVARVQLHEGNGQVIINGRPFEEVLPRISLQAEALAPLAATSTTGQYSVMAKVEGGGVSGWAGAISLGIARALLEVNAELRPVLRKGGLLTRDARIKERKKYGLKRARKAPQYTKR